MKLYELIKVLLLIIIINLFIYALDHKNSKYAIESFFLNENSQENFVISGTEDGKISIWDTISAK